MIIPNLSPFITKKNTTIAGLLPTITLLMYLIVFGAGEYSVTNHVDDSETLKDELHKVKKTLKKMKVELEALTDIICSNPEFICTK